MGAAPKTSTLIVQGPVGQLEVLVDDLIGQPRHVALVCHPHPLMGGTMTNKVAHILARAFNDLGAPAVRFNFRGVGASAGVHDDGRGETEDVLAMLAWMENRWPETEVWLAGFSFGAAMALRASLKHRVAKLVTVAPALQWLNELNTTVPECPWLIIQGDRDELVNVDAVRKWIGKLPKPPELKIISGAEHFFHGRLNDLRDAVKEWIPVSME